MEAYLISSMSPGFQLLSMTGSVGEYSLRMTKYPLPGTVASQLLCFPSGAFGPRYFAASMSGNTHGY